MREVRKMVKRIISLILIILTITTIFGSQFLNKAYAKTCEEAFEECIEVYALDNFWGFVVALSYCQIGYYWCLVFYPH